MRHREYSKIDQIPSGDAKGAVTPGCLLLEGGAFRGLYTMGVTDYWMEQGLNFACTAGVSAGGLVGMAYHCGYIGRCARINLRFRHDKRYVGINNLPTCRSPLRLEFIFKDYPQIEPFDEKRLFNSERRFAVEVTNCLTGQPHFFDLSNCSDIYQAVIASASLPYISPMIEVDGTPYLDGGCVCRLPYKWAMQQGYEKTVIVRTRDPSFRKKVSNRHFAAKFYRKYPEFAASLDNTNAAYNRDCDALEQLHAEGKLFVVAPSRPVTVSRLEGNMEKLGDLYWLGYYDAQRSFAALQKFLSA